MIQISFPRAMDWNEWYVRYGGFENGKVVSLTRLLKARDCVEG